jgi:hypothetical protein
MPSAQDAPNMTFNYYVTCRRLSESMPVEGVQYDLGDAGVLEEKQNNAGGGSIV